MKKFIFLLCLFVFAAGWSPMDVIPAYKNLKTDIVGQLNDLFGREISVENISGILVNQIELNNVRIAKNKKLSEGTIIKAKKMVINYNPFKLAASRGNISAAISKVTIIEPDVIVERFKNDTWNMADLMPKGKAIEGEKAPGPLMLSCTIVIMGGFGSYIDHLGWGEDLKGKPFISKIKDFNGEIKLSGNKINVSCTGTSIVDRSVAYTRTTGNVNIKTGKYKFNVTAKNVDIEKFGYYTMNIPNFKAKTGISDMTLTMTNPVPGKNRLPILFDGKFNIKNGTAYIFGKLFENLNGFVRVFDEEATFKGLTGTHAGLAGTANGRLFDFAVANYDIQLAVPKTDSEAIKKAFPELSAIKYSGGVRSIIHIGGNYGAPILDSVLDLDGSIYSQKINGKASLFYEASKLNVSSNDLKIYGGKIKANGSVDYSRSTPNIYITVSGEGISLKEALRLSSAREKARINASLIGTTASFDLDILASTKNMGEMQITGRYRDNSLDMDIFGQNIVGFSEQNIESIDGSLSYKNGTIKIKRVQLQNGTSTIVLKGLMGAGVESSLNVDAVSAEASDLTILNAFLPKEIRPVTGKMDMHLLLSGIISGETLSETSGLKVTGQIKLSNGSVGNEKIDEANMNFVWENSNLNLDNARFRSGYTDIDAFGTFEANGKIALSLVGKLDLSTLKNYTLKYGRVFGQADLDCKITGSITKPVFDTTFDVNKLRYNEIFVDRILGRIKYDGESVELLQPLKIDHEKDEYSIVGNIKLGKTPSVDAEFDVVKGDISTMALLFDEINNELRSKQLLSGQTKQKTIFISPINLEISSRRSEKIYESDAGKTLLDRVKKAESDVKDLSVSFSERPRRNVSGKLDGQFKIKGPVSDLAGQITLNISSGTWETFSFDEAKISGHMHGGTFEADSIYLKKDEGILNMSGYFDLNNTGSIEIMARNMPVDILSLLLGKGKTLKGEFDLDAGLSGSLASPKGSIALRSNDVNVGGIALDRLNSNINIHDKTFYILNTELAKDNDRSLITGNIPLEKEIFMNITMEGAAIGLVTLLTNDLSWNGGSGKGNMIISGKLDHPKFNGLLVLDGCNVYVKPIDCDLTSIDSTLYLTNNTITTESLNAKLNGSWTGKKINKLRLSGSFSWDNLFTDARAVDLNLKLKDTTLALDIPDLYKGDLDIENVSFVGPLSVSGEARLAPKLSGVFTMSNGAIKLPDMSKESTLPPVDFDITLNIGKNTYVEAGDTRNLISSDFSNLIMNLEIEGKDIKVTGSLDSPNVIGKTTFNRGTVNILNREFSLINEDRQKFLFSTSLDKVTNNEAIFSSGSLPHLTLSAEIKVKATQRAGEPAPGEPVQYVSTNVLVVSRIKGVPFSKDKDEGINLSFDSFTEDTTKTPSEFLPGKYDEQEIKVLLLPDFIKGSLGIDERGVEAVDANAVVAEYLNSRLNSYLLRDVERQVAKSLDLDSLSLEYNFGKDIKGMLPANEAVTPLSPQGYVPETAYGVGAVKGFFDKFYMDVRYSQAVQEPSVVNRALLNYQLTYKLSPSLSVVYYREPFSFIEAESDYYKFTIKTGYQLY
jgi:hypothetical protein